MSLNQIRLPRNRICLSSSTFTINLAPQTLSPISRKENIVTHSDLLEDDFATVLGHLDLAKWSTTSRRNIVIPGTAKGEACEMKVSVTG